MSLGLVGRKIGMTRIFTDDGSSLPVTVLDVSNNRVAQIKTADSDGYTAVQVAFGARRPSRVSKAAAGHFAKAGVEAGSVLKEFTISAEEAAAIIVRGLLDGQTEIHFPKRLSWPLKVMTALPRPVYEALARRMMSGG